MVLEAAVNGRADAPVTYNVRDFAVASRIGVEVAKQLTMLAKTATMRFPSKSALRLPASLKKAAEEEARRDGATLNAFIVTAVAEKVSALKTADYFATRTARADLSAFDEILSRARTCTRLGRRANPSRTLLGKQLCWWR